METVYLKELKIIKMKNDNIEEAIQEPTHVMDDIVKKNDKFETIRVLMEILCKELEIGADSKPNDIFKAIQQVSIDYYKAMDEFRELRNAGQGREGKNISREVENGKK